MCDCFLCKNKDKPELLVAYLTGQREAYEWFLNWAKKNNIGKGIIGENSLESIHSEIEYNYQSAGEYLAEVEYELKNKINSKDLET